MSIFKAKPLDTLDLCKILNDDIAQRVVSHPKRFVGLGTLPMQVNDKPQGLHSLLLKSFKIKQTFVNDLTKLE